MTNYPQISPVGKKIISLLDQKKQTQEWLAVQVDVSSAYISQIVSGARTNPTLKITRRVEEVLNEKIW